jgi:hypothetical protein
MPLLCPDVHQFPYVIVRYSKDNVRALATIIFYAVSYEHACFVQRVLIESEHHFDPLAHYAIRVTTELYSSLYTCACGK